MSKTFILTMDNGDVIQGELYPEKAPKTVENFEKLANEGFYDGLIFHRVIKGFMNSRRRPKRNWHGWSRLYNSWRIHQ